MPDPEPTLQDRKPPRRIWLFAPYIGLLVAAIAWTGVWLAEKRGIEKALNERAARWSAAGVETGFSDAAVDGWPFRLRLRLTAPHLADHAGWSLSAPYLIAEAAAYAPTTWTIAAPEGLTVGRPGKGTLMISGRSLRASVGALGSAAPRLSFEGLDLNLAPMPGAQPAPLAAARRIEAHLQPGPDDQAALLIRIDDGALQPESSLARLAPGKPFSLIWDSRLQHLSALHGPTWPAALQAWVRSGGAVRVAAMRLSLGDAALQGAGGPLSVDSDSRLAGSLPLTLDRGKAGGVSGIGVLETNGPIPLKFEDGRATIGPVPLGPALKIG
jgi:hypothetical protein